MSDDPQSRRIVELRAALRAAQLRETLTLSFRVLATCAAFSRKLQMTSLSVCRVAGEVFDNVHSAFSTLTGLLGGEGEMQLKRIQALEAELEALRASSERPTLPPFPNDDELPVALPVLKNLDEIGLVSEIPFAAVAVHPSR